MNKDDANKILGIMKAAYPNMKIDDPVLMVSIWQRVYRDIPLEIVSRALRHFIENDRSGYPPSIGQISGIIRQWTEHDTESKADTVNSIMAAARDSIWHSKERFDELSPLAKRIAGSPEQLKVWAMMEADDVETVIRSHLMRLYDAEKEREDVPELPTEMAKKIRELTGKLSLDENLSDERRSG